MACWLFKEEPDHYSYADLERDGSSLWSGVNNNLARKHLRQVKRGDRIFYYHTGKEKAIVGEMKAAADTMPDPNGDDDQAVMVKVEPVKRLARPVGLAEIKQEAQLKDWELVRMSRLSVMPVSPDQWKRVEALSQGKS